MYNAYTVESIWSCRLKLSEKGLLVTLQALQVSELYQLATPFMQFWITEATLLEQNLSIFTTNCTNWYKIQPKSDNAKGIICG